MNAGILSGRFLRHVYSEVGTQAEMLLVEPNGDEHWVRCLVRTSGTDVGGDADTLAYLNERYGPEHVCAVARETTFGKNSQ